MENNNNNNDMLQIFNSEQFGKLRIAKINDKDTFNLSDVCFGLGYTKSDGRKLYLRKDNIENICETLDIKGLSLDDRDEFEILKDIDFDNTYITEDAFYDLCLESKAKHARPFRKWVTSDVLPSINKHGAYMTEEVIEKTLTDPDFIIQLATQLKEERIKRIASENKIQEQKLLIEEQAPKVELADRLFICDAEVNIGEVAKLFNERIRKGKSIGRTKLFEILREHEILMVYGSEKNNPRQKYIDNGCFVLKTSTFDNGYGGTKMSSTTKVTPKGINWLWNFLIKKGYIMIDDVLGKDEE